MADFGPKQPQTRGEKENVAREVLGQTSPKAKSRAPRFHRMSITAAQNGVSVSHTVKVKRGKTTKSGEQHTVGFPMSGEDTVENTTEHVFGHDHPLMEHLHAIHSHIMNNSRAEGMKDFDDGDGD